MKIDKNKYHLPDHEAQRTQSILKRAIDVEKGIAPPEETSVTEEHPDGCKYMLFIFPNLFRFIFPENMLLRM